MNLGDPELELIDPTPNIHALFLSFDNTFFWNKLASRAVVKWSKRMYSCAGVCSYEGRGGLCTIALSEPLLKLRPRKNLIETLLHEMIHAYLFVASKDRDRDGHGPNFKSHMYRINKAAGLNITIYHDFHDEVKLYQTHWWRCDGPCQHLKPCFGILRRSINRAPGPTDSWWSAHKRLCGGAFIKIQEPKNYGKKVTGKTNKATSDITKFTTNAKTGLNAVNTVLKDHNCNSATGNTNPAIIIGKKDVYYKPLVVKPASTGVGKALNDRKRTSSTNVVETVRNVWSNKNVATTPVKHAEIKKDSPNVPKGKQKADQACPVPPKRIKVMQIDNYFPKNASAVLKDVYGQDFDVKLSNSGNKFVAVVRKAVIGETAKAKAANTVQEQTNKPNMIKASKNVACPVCSAEIDNVLINKHLDECLNRKIIDKIKKESNPTPDAVNNRITIKPLKQNMWEDIPKFQINNSDIKLELPESLNLSFANELFDGNNKISPTNRNVTEGKLKDPYKPIIESKDNDLERILNTAQTNINITNMTEKDYPNIKGKTEKQDNSAICPCCGEHIVIPIEQHLDECLSFFNNNNTVPKEGANVVATLVLNDDDDFDETLTFNATGTKSLCPCCLQMIEQNVMNDHLHVCLS